MKTLLTWLIVLAFLWAVARIRVGVRVLYEEKELFLELLVSRWRMALVGGEKKSQKRKKTKAQQKKSNPKEQLPKEKKPKQKGNILENPWVQAVLEYWREILSLIGRVLTSPTLDLLRLQLWIGGSDAEKCAMTYGRICAVIGGVLPVVENTFGIRKQQINVWCCYDRDSLDIAAEAAITVRIYEIFALVFALLGLGLKILIQARNNKKAVQNS